MYVEREALLNKQYEIFHKGTCRYRKVIDAYDVANAPSEEVKDVVHARWVKYWCDNNMLGHEYEECSNCGTSMLDTNQFWDCKRCPNCGAYMR